MIQQEIKSDDQLHANSDLVIFSDPLYHQIISAISHELRTPVTIIKSNIALIKKFTYEMNSSVKEECFSLCDESVNQLEKFLENIQLLNNINNSTIHPHIALFRVKEIIQHVYFRLSQINLDYRRIKLHWELQDSHIISDKKFINQLLFKLLSNALKFSEGNVNLSIASSHHQLTIIVQDWGIGIAEDELEMIFHPFYRASNVKNITGIGLGLAIVQSLVKILGGTIQISSTIAKGTTVQINLAYELPKEDTSN